MFKSLLVLFMFFIGINLYSQNTVILKGKVLEDKTQVPLEAATVYITSVADSTVIDYTITDKSGNFQMNLKKIAKPIFVKVSHMGYEEFKSRKEDLTESLDLGTLHLSEIQNTIGEVVIKSEAPPVRIKNDTLEFNASSFRLRPDANVETLLKQLPGVEIDTDGKITVNGKEVNQILVNGKPFFDKDGKIALQNLPSDIINKVQVTDSKTKKEELSGQKATSNEASINLTIDEEKNKGFFGKVMGGYGSDRRYESSLLFNYFKDKQKFSVLASSNNINSTGFSMNEIFDNMGGGRNQSVYVNDNGSFGINGMRFGGGAGITQSNIVGLNYADQYFKEFDVNGSYFYTDSDSENTNRMKQLTLLPDGNFTTQSLQKTRDFRSAHNFNMVFEYKIDSTTSFYFSPKFVRADSKYKRSSNEFSVDDSGQLLNENEVDYNDDTDNQSFASSFYYNTKFKKKGRAFSAYFDNENNKEEVLSLNRSTSAFYDDTDGDGITDEETFDIRDQRRQKRNFKDNYGGGLDFYEPILDSVKLKIGIDYRHNLLTNQKATFDFNPLTGSYNLFNDEQSNYLTSVTKMVTPNGGLSFETKKLNGGFNVGVAFNRFENESFYLGNRANVSNLYVYPSINGWLDYKLTKSKSLNIYYDHSRNMPAPIQVLPVEDLSDPLNTIIGNPDIRPDRTHAIYLYFRDYDYATKKGYSFHGGINYLETAIVSSTTYDVSRKSTTRYANVNGTYNGWFGGSWNKTVKKDAHSFKYGFGVNSNFGKSKGFTNGEAFEANTFRLTPRLNLTYDYGELLSVTPTYSVSWQNTNYKNFVIDQASTVLHKFNLQLTSRWPKHVVFGTDLGYTYNTNIADGFKKDFYLLNVSLGYNFFKEKLLAKVKVYDLLDQNQSTARFISATYVRDEENTVLRRYVMFSLTYKLDQFAGSKKQ